MARTKKWNFTVTFWVLFLGLILPMVSCSPASDKLVPVPKKVLVNEVHDTYDPVVDILFVIDDSGSMASHQTNLSNNVDIFINEFKNFQLLNYHVGVVTTDVDASSKSGKLQGTPTFVDNQTPNLQDVLRQNMMVGTSGSGTERPLEGSYLALTDPNLSNENLGFYRPNADIAIVYVTDAEDQSDRTGWGSSPHHVQRPEDMFDLLFNLKNGEIKKIHLYGVLVPSKLGNSSTCSRDEYGVYPYRMEKLLNMVNGLEFDICDVDFGTKVAQIAKDLIGQIKTSIRLSKIPKPESIAVIYGTQVIPRDAHVGWTYDTIENTIRLAKDLVLLPQPLGTKMEIKFQTY